MSLFKKLAGQTAIYGISSVLARLLNLILTPYYTSDAVFGPGVYGHYIDLYSQIALINVLLIFGMETTFFRFSQDVKDFRKIFTQAFIWVQILAWSFLILGSLLHQPIANVTGYEDHSNWVLMTIIVVFLDVSAALPLARLRYEERVMRFAVINIINVVLTIGMNLILIEVLGAELIYVFIANIVASSIRLLMAMWGNLPLSLKPAWKVIRQLIDYGMYMAIAQLAGMMVLLIDRILMSRIWEDGNFFEGVARTGSELNGIYGAVYKVAALLMLGTQAFRYAVEPFFFKEAKEKDSPETFAKVFHYYMLAALAVFLILASFTYEIVTFEVFGYTFIGPAYQSGLPAVPILLMAYVINGAYVNLSIWFKITKQVRFAILFTGVGASISIILNLLTIPKYGYYGSAWTVLIAYIVMSTMIYLTGKKHYPIPYRMMRFGLYLGIFLFAFFVNRQIGPTDGYWPAFLFKTLVCLGTFGLIIGLERYYPPFKNAS